MVGYSEVTDPFRISVVNAVNVCLSLMLALERAGVLSMDSCHTIFLLRGKQSIEGPESTVTCSGSEDTAVTFAQNLLTGTSLVFAHCKGGGNLIPVSHMPRGTEQGDLPK